MPKEFWNRAEVYWIQFRDAALMKNSASEYLTAAAAMVIVFFGLWIVKGFLTRRFTKWGEETGRHAFRTLGEAGRSTRLWFLLAIAIFCGSLFLRLPGEPLPIAARLAADDVAAVEAPVGPSRARLIINAVTIAALLIQSGFWGNKFMSFGVERFVRATAADEGAGKMTASAISLIGGIVLWSIILMAILANFGVNVTAMVAGLGVGGIAIALAAQNILGDLFSSLSIVLDKPFVLGDFIVVGDYMGSVERVGLKTTRIRSLGGEQVIFSNSDLLQSRIRNFKRMSERRIVFSIGIAYETPAEKIKAVPDMLREIVSSQENVRFDRAHFQKYGDFALIYEVVYYVLVPDFNVYMNIQQQINFEILDRLQSQGIALPYPTQTLYVQRGESHSDE